MLRPPRLRAAFAANVAGDLDDETLETIEDEAVRDLITRQEAIGMPIVVDGEFRRSG